jgi:hypothetical protein
MNEFYEKWDEIVDAYYYSGELAKNYPMLDEAIREIVRREESN